MGGNQLVTEAKRTACIRRLTRWLELSETDPHALDGLSKDLRALSPDEESAQNLCDLLKDRRLEWLRDAQGRNLRALAVAALLRLGYPWALVVTPEDLSLMRSEERAATAPVLRWMNALIALGPFFVAAAVLAGLAMLQRSGVAASMVLLALCSSATAAATWMGAFHERRREGFRAAAAVAILACITEWGWGIAVGGLDLMMVGSLPVALCAVLSMTASLVTPATLDA
jgi:hypothetical protein